VILFSLLGAWTVSTLAFERLHVLVFVIGSLLSGVAIDYGFYIFMQPVRSADETYAEKLRRLLKPLLASCLTTVIGFLLLLASDLPLLRQVGLFVAAGLICALGAAMLYFAQLDRAFLASRDFGRPARLPRALPLALLALALAAAVVGPWRLRWRDDVRELEIPAPELQANDRELRTLFGDAPGRSLFLTHGATVAEARQHLQEFMGYARQAAPQATAASLGLAFPTEAAWRAQPERLGELENFAAEFRVALGRHGFTPGAFAEFFTAWNAFLVRPAGGDYMQLYADFSRELTGPLALLYRAEGPMSWFLTIVTAPDVPAPPAALGTVAINQLESLNDLFRRYRWSGLRLSLAGLALVIASVFAIYRGRSAVRIALIPAGACFVVFGLFGIFGATLNLFHLLGAFLGVCLSHNYAIFSAETAARGDGPPVSIRLSALSTATSFGVLAFSRIPVIHALGLTVALIVLTALATVELEPFAVRRRA
jgi:predicted exporter